MMYSLSALLLLATLPAANACPFAAGGGAALPSDHVELDDDGKPCASSATPPRRLRMASLRDDPATQERLRGVVSRRVNERKDDRNNNDKNARRSLQAGGACFTRSTYDDIRDDVRFISEAILDVPDRGHFLGGIVRLAAHDFMDYDPRTEHNDGRVLGMDGCFDTQAPDNNGLETIWCNNTALCPLKNVYDNVYALEGVGRADFWVAAANAVVKITSRGWTDSIGSSHDDLDLPFRYGRVDNDDCAAPEHGGSIDSAARLPGAQHCDEVQRTFLDQMGLSWTDAVALLGAHTLGFGNSDFSGHQGMWVDEVDETISFDKRYYEEINRRAWRPRNRGAANEDWTWAGNNGGNPRMMLNADLCLAFDIDDSPDCCSLIRDGGAGTITAVEAEAFCHPPGTDLSTVTTVQCTNSSTVRPEAFNAVNEFAVSLRNGASGANGDNRPFYEAYIVAWKKATEAGYAEGALHGLAETCAPTDPPTFAPTEVPTTDAPTSSPTSTPTSAPTVSPTVAPTFEPTDMPTPTCTDDAEFQPDKGPLQDCQWAVDTDRCEKYGIQHCPVKCGMCGCAANGDACNGGHECCSGLCRGSGTCRAAQTSA